MDEEQLLQLVDFENQYRETHLGEDNVVENHVYVNDEKIFPKYWYSRFDDETRLDLLAKALERGQLVEELDEYRQMNDMVNAARISDNIDESIGNLKR